MIPQSFIDDLLYRLDIADVVGRYVPLKHAGVNLQGLCPFHKEKSPSFSVSPAKQFYHCFGCGASGNAIGFVMEHLGLTFPEAVEHLAGSLGIEVPHEQGDLIPEAVLSERDHLIQLLTQAAAWYKNQLKRSPEAVSYLKTRGLTGEVAARYGLGYAPDHYHNLQAIVPAYDNTPLLDTAGLTKGTEEGGRRYDRFRARIMFPIRNGKGQVIGFGGRVLGQGEPKYLNSPETPVFSKGQEVYGLFEARQPIHKMGYALVTEGYMDVVALAQWGFENAVATLGTAVTPEHVQKLFKQTDRLVFAFDGDTAGQKAAWRALQACLSHINEHKRADFMFFPAEHDPDSFIRTEGPEGFLALLAQALSLTEFLSKHVEQQFPLHQMEGRAAAIAFLKPLVHQMQQTVLRASVIRGLAELLACTPAELSQHLSVKTQISKGEYFSPRGKKDKFGRADGQQRYMAPRPQAKSPLLSLAARLVKVPHLAHECNELVALYEREQKPQNEVHSFIHFLAQVKKDPNLLEARLQHVFNDAVHQDWVNAVLKEARSLDEAMNLEVELKAAVHHCSELWFKTELQRLSEKLSVEPETIKIYQECMLRYQELKQKRVNQL